MWTAEPAFCGAWLLLRVKSPCCGCWNFTQSVGYSSVCYYISGNFIESCVCGICSFSSIFFFFLAVVNTLESHKIFFLMHLQNGLNELCMLSRFSRVRLFVTPWTVVRQAPLSMSFSRQEYWSGLPCPPPGDPPDPGIELMSHVFSIGRWILYH